MAEIFDITSSRRDHTQIDLLNNENTWLKAQNCAIAPSENYNLVNKAYVDELFEIKQQGTPTSITVADTASKSVIVAAVTKSVSKSYSAFNTGSIPPSNLDSSIGGGGTYYFFIKQDTFTYNLTFDSIPTITTSNSIYYRVSSVNTSTAIITLYGQGYNLNSSGTWDVNTPAGTVTATGKIANATNIYETLTFTKSFGVVFKNIPTITNLVNCEVSDITTSSCTVTVPMTGSFPSAPTGSTITLSNTYSFIVNGNV